MPAAVPHRRADPENRGDQARRQAGQRQHGSNQGATTTAGVNPLRSGMSATNEEAVNSDVRVRTIPSRSMKPDTLLVVATAISRRDSIARARVMANCCSICPVPP